MNIKEAKDFLKHHQPMPNDFEITEAEGDMYSSIIEYLENEKNPDMEFIPLLINSVSEHTNLGMYEHINFVFLKFNKAILIPHLREGLKNGNNGSIYRCIWWAIEADAWELWGEIEHLNNHGNGDVIDAVQTFYEIMSERN